MVSSVFAEKIQPQLLLVQKIARNIALSLLLMSVVIPISYQVINAQAQSNNAINAKTKVTVEKVMKDRTKITQSATLQEISYATKLTKLDKFKQKQFTLTSEQIQKIQQQQGVFTQDGKVVINQPILSSLGFNLDQIDAIQNLVQSYNSQTIKEVKISLGVKVAQNAINPFIIQAQAASCDPYVKTDFYWWGFTTFLSNCLIQDFNMGVLTAGTISGVVIVAGAEPTPLGELILLYLGLYIGAININNDRCNNAGVNFSATYAAIAVGWVSAVC